MDIFFYSNVIISQSKSFTLLILNSVCVYFVCKSDNRSMLIKVLVESKSSNIGVIHVLFERKNAPNRPRPSHLARWLGKKKGKNCTRPIFPFWFPSNLGSTSRDLNLNFLEKVSSGRRKHFKFSRKSFLRTEGTFLIF